VALLLAGCAGDDGEEAADTATPFGATTAAGVETLEQPGGTETRTLRVYFLRDGKVAPVAREVPETTVVARQALTELLEGTSGDEGPLELRTAIPEDSEIGAISIANGAAFVEIDTSSQPSEKALAQVVYTLTQFPTIESVAMRFGELDIDARTRADFEEQTPGILVESPLPLAEVASPLKVSGTANVFEANVVFNVLDANGKVVLESFTTATAGNGQRGTFETTLDLAAAPKGFITLTAFEPSAEDGSHLHEVQLPLVLE
jgi:hypothetical protein